jgi:MFS family permease
MMTIIISVGRRSRQGAAPWFLIVWQQSRRARGALRLGCRGRGTFLTSLTTAGAVGLPGAFILPLSKEFGWDAAQISGALAIRFALFGLMAPFAAALIGRYGMRRMMLLALALVAVSFARRGWR